MVLNSSIFVPNNSLITKIKNLNEYVAENGLQLKSNLESNWI